MLKKSYSKVLVIIYSITIVTFLSVIYLTLSQGDSSYKIEEYSIDSVITESGDMLVTEYVKYYFNENIDKITKTIQYNNINLEDSMQMDSKRYNVSNIENLKVYTSDNSFEAMQQLEYSENDDEKTYLLLRDVGKDSIIINLDEENIVKKRQKYVKYEYILKDIVVNYEDYAEICYNYINSEWYCNISNVNINVILPDGTKKYVSYLDTYALMSEKESNNNSSIIAYSIAEVVPETFVNVRIIFSNEYMVALKNIDKKYDFIALKEVQDEFQNNKIKYYKSIKYYLIIAASSIVLMYIITKIQYAYKNEETEKYNRNIRNYKGKMQGEMYTKYPLIVNIINIVFFIFILIANTYVAIKVFPLNYKMTTVFLGIIASCIFLGFEYLITLEILQSKKEYTELYNNLLKIKKCLSNSIDNEKNKNKKNNE